MKKTKDLSKLLREKEKNEILNRSKNFPEVIRNFMIVGDVSQADLVRASQLSKTTVGNIFNDTNGRKGEKKKPYVADMNTVETMARAWGLNQEQTKKLFYIAFPQFKAWEYCNEKGLNIVESNEYIYGVEPTLPLLGSQEKEY